MPTIPVTVVPARTLLAALALCAAAAACTVWAALQMPWLGLSLSLDDTGETVVAHAVPAGPSARVGAGAALLSLAGPSHPGGMALTPSDLIEEPDFFDEYSDMNAFFARQTILAELLREPVQLTWSGPDGTQAQAEVVPTHRPLAALPAPFWFQIAVSCAGFLIACWVWALRPADWGARMFALTGLTFPMFALPAAVYSTRELALDGALFHALSIANHVGAFLFGCALLALFLSYPRQLVRPRWLLVLPVVYGAWVLADSLQIMPNQNWVRMGIMSEMIGAIVLAGVQWRRSKGRPLDRAALRWLALSTLVGSGLFVFSTIGAAVLGLFPAISQGYSFGYFLIIYVGLAFGLRRYRLFELDRWAYRILLWLAGALAVVLMDAALMIWLQMNPALSLGVTLLLCGWLYFPFRQWLWRRLTGERADAVADAFPELVGIAFSGSKQEQESRWDALLRQLFDPAEIRYDGDVAAGDAELVDSGLALQLPSAGGIGGRTLRLASRGRRLFAMRDLQLAQSLIQLMRRAAEGRDAYERGVSEERVRIGRDMHDDIGARLLMLIHHAQRADDAVAADVARAAMTDLRTTLSALDGQHMPLPDALADWRAEMASRCETAGVAFAWTEDVADEAAPGVPALSPRLKATLERALRESLSNALKHADPSRVAVDVHEAAGSLVIDISNDDSRQLAGGEETPWRDGRGMRGMRSRLAEFGGRVEVARDARGSRVRIVLDRARHAEPTAADREAEMPAGAVAAIQAA